jgi:hypothetical protein
MVAITRFVRRLRDERGAELIEMAMVTPILLMILAGIFDFGFLFRSWEVTTNAAREGARAGILPGYSCEAASADIQSRVDQYMAAAGISDPYTVTTGLVTVPNADADLEFTGCAVRVSMFAQLPSLSVIGQFFGGAFTSVPVAAQTIMRTEDQAVAP